MIADYLYNTPAPPAGSTVAVVLFATAYADSESLNAVVHGKTLAEIAANSIAALMKRYKGQIEDS